MFVSSHDKTSEFVGGDVTVSTSAKSENSRIALTGEKTPLSVIVSTFSIASTAPPFPRSESKIVITSPTALSKPNVTGVAEVRSPEESTIISNVPTVLELLEEVPVTPLYVPDVLLPPFISVIRTAKAGGEKPPAPVTSVIPCVRESNRK